MQGRERDPRITEEPETVFYVTWTDPSAAARRGRHVSLDKEGRPCEVFGADRTSAGCSKLSRSSDHSPFLRSSHGAGARLEESVAPCSAPESTPSVQHVEIRIHGS